MMKYAVKLNCVEIAPWINMKENNTKKRGKIIGALPLQPRSIIEFYNRVLQSSSNASAQYVYPKHPPSVSIQSIRPQHPPSASALSIRTQHPPSASAISIRTQHPPGGLRGCPPPPSPSPEQLIRQPPPTPFLMPIFLVSHFIQTPPRFRKP